MAKSRTVLAACLIGGATSAAALVMLPDARDFVSLRLRSEQPVPFCEAYLRPRHGAGGVIVASGSLEGGFEHGYVISSPDCDKGPGLNWVGAQNDPDWKRLDAALMRNAAPLPGHQEKTISGTFTGRLRLEDGDHRMVLDVERVSDLKIEPRRPDLKAGEVNFLVPPSFDFARPDAPSTEMECEIRTDGRLRLCYPSPDGGPLWETGWQRSDKALEQARVAPRAKDGSPTRGRKIAIRAPLTDDRRRLENDP
jgi:hypothetical protein